MVCKGTTILKEPDHQFILVSLSRHRRDPLAKVKPGGEDISNSEMRKRHPVVGMSL